MVENCVFCDIYKGKQSSDVLYKDDEIIIFSDVKPAAEHHYLIVPKVHIRDAKQLSKNDEPLVETLVCHGKRILEEKGAKLSESRFGFHWPPFHTVSHLHLHAISPVSQMSWISRLIYNPGSLWFVSLKGLSAAPQEVVKTETGLLLFRPVFRFLLKWLYSSRHFYHDNKIKNMDPEYVLRRLARL